MLRPSSALTALLSLSGAVSLAQGQERAVRVTLKSGKTIDGTLVSNDPGLLIIRGGAGPVFLSPDEFTNVEQMSSAVSASTKEHVLCPLKLLRLLALSTRSIEEEQDRLRLLQHKRRMAAASGNTLSPDENKDFWSSLSSVSSVPISMALAVSRRKSLVDEATKERALVESCHVEPERFLVRDEPLPSVEEVAAATNLYLHELIKAKFEVTEFVEEHQHFLSETLTKVAQTTEGPIPERHAALRLLGYLERADVVPILLAALKDSDSGVRRLAAFGLRKRSSEPCTAALCDALQGEGNRGVRRQIFLALRTQNAKQSIPTLITTLASERDIEQQICIREVLRELSGGQDCGTDSVAWHEWWAQRAGTDR